MGNLGERLRQALLAHGEQERRSEMRGKEIQERVRQEKEKRDAEDRARQGQELRATDLMLGEVRARGFLEYVKQSAWRVGEITIGKQEVVLCYKYKGVLFEHRVSQGGSSHVSSTKGIVSEELRIRSYYDPGYQWVKQPIITRRFSVGYSHYLTPTGGAKIFFREEEKLVVVEGEDYVKARNDVEQVLYELCENQIGSETLPLDNERRFLNGTYNFRR